MKIICKDNFDRETRSESLVCDNIKDRSLADLMVKALNQQGGPYSEEFYVVKEDDYKLYVYEP